MLQPREINTHKAKLLQMIPSSNYTETSKTHTNPQNYSNLLKLLPANDDRERERERKPHYLELLEQKIEIARNGGGFPRS